jgi:hypothetical protein
MLSRFAVMVLAAGRIERSFQCSGGFLKLKDALS